MPRKTSKLKKIRNKEEQNSSKSSKSINKIVDSDKVSKKLVKEKQSDEHYRDFVFKREQRSFFISPEDKEYKKLKKKEQKRIKKAKKKYEREVKRFAKKGEEWSYEGL